MIMKQWYALYVSLYSYGNSIYLFDSHARDSNGAVQPDYSAILMSFGRNINVLNFILKRFGYHLQSEFSM